MPIPAQEVLSSNCRFKVLYGGRGSGKSFSVANYLIIEALRKSHRILCAREMMNSIRDSVHRLLVDRICDMKLESFFEIQRDSIYCRINKSEFLFKGIHSNVSEIKSLQGVTKVWLEESEKVTNDSFDILLPTIREENSEIILTFNPESNDSPSYKRFVENPLPNSISRLVNFYDNDYFPEVLRQEQEWCKATDEEKWRWIWMGELKKYAQDIIFKRVRIEEFPAPPDDMQYFCGADWGFSADPTAVVQCFIQNNNLYIDEEFYGHGVEIDQLPDALNTLSAIRRGFRIIADSARPDTISYLQNKGFNIDGAEKGKGSVEDGIQFLKSFSEIIIHPRCKGAVDEFTNYRWKKDRITGDILPIPLDKSNNSVDATRYAIESWQRAGVSIFDAIPRNM